MDKKSELLKKIAELITVYENTVEQFVDIDISIEGASYEWNGDEWTEVKDEE